MPGSSIFLKATRLAPSFFIRAAIRTFVSSTMLIIERGRIPGTSEPCNFTDGRTVGKRYEPPHAQRVCGGMQPRSPAPVKDQHGEDALRRSGARFLEPPAPSCWRDPKSLREPAPSGRCLATPPMLSAVRFASTQTSTRFSTSSQRGLSVSISPLRWLHRRGDGQGERWRRCCIRSRMGR